MNVNVIFVGNTYTIKTYLFRERVELQHRNPCIICAPTGKYYDAYSQSKGETEVAEYIESLYTDKIERNNRTILNGLELDIYLPKLNLAFEYDGTYWHMDSRFHKPTDYQPTKKCTAQEIWDYDNNKITECSKLNIKLIRIKEYDWLHNKEKVKDEIKKLIYLL